YLSGFVVKENSPIVSNFRAKSSLSAFLKKNKVPAVEGIDTRALVRHIRDAGAKPALIHVGVVTDFSKLKKKAAALPSMEGQDLAKVVSCKKPYGWNRGSHRIVRMVGAQGHEVVPPRGRAPVQKKKFNVIAYDFGIKQNILRMLVDAGCRVKVVPADYPAEEVLGQNPDGVFLSNGPGDPAAVPYAVDTVRQLLGKKPIFGICLGHQILGQAFGGKTYKLKFGHRGGNHPVLDRRSGRVEITTQNHGFAVDPGSLPPEVELTHVNLNDHTLEGMRHKELPVFSVQYHPEASPGPHDAGYLFSRFIDLMKGA
ncbi:MAG: glutamine-hydrolyzing carbamoyl-phosphate synthase small subunit, partial [Candidatus Tectomicrobia bacterium]|nr:glutamine-hydrolyzing carbamoyl-phosphate synthase small subunit [Candidatus Tectomicrobia bacterium]